MGDGAILAAAWQFLRMLIGILDSQAFGCRGGVKFVVGREEE